MGALDGLRVLDLTRLLPGPVGSLVLADLGATVDKVEDPGGGDYVRLSPPQVGDQSVLFSSINRGKRSLVLDLKNPEGPKTLLRLVTRYDVLFEQFRPGVLDRLGVGHSTLLKENPKLVVCALTGYGQDGPLAQRAGHDLNYLARAGILGFQGPPDGLPYAPGYQLADVGGALWSVIGILAALRQRDRTGRGSVVDVSMNEAVVPFAASPLSHVLAGQTTRKGGEVLTGGIAPYRTYETRDGRYVALGALEPKFLMKFLSVAGIEADLSCLAPGEHQKELMERFAAAFKTKTRDEWAALGAEHDCMLEPVLEPDELREDPHLKARGVFCEYETEAGPVGQFRTPVTPRDLPASAGPNQGEHTEAVLRDAGFSSEEIAKLRDDGVVR